MSRLRVIHARRTSAATMKTIARMTNRWIAPVTRCKTSQQTSQSTSRIIAIVQAF